MKHFYLVLLLLPAQLLAQSRLPNFLHHSTKEVGKSLAAQHLAFDTSFRYPESGPTVDYVAYAPYKVSGIPGVLLVRGSDTVREVQWYSRGLDVDSDLSDVIQRNPSGSFSIAVRQLGKTIVSPADFNSVIDEASDKFGLPTRHFASGVAWPQCRSVAMNDGVIRFEESIPLDPRALQPEVYPRERAMEIRARMSPGLRGLPRSQVQSILTGKYDAMYSNVDSTTMEYGPYNFHGIAGILKTYFDPRGICVALKWSSSDPESLISSQLDTGSGFSHVVRAFDDSRVTPEQYNSLRETVGLPTLENPRGMRHLAYYPVHQMLNFDTGRLEYEESKTLRPMSKGMYLAGCEPTMNVMEGQ